MKFKIHSAYFLTNMAAIKPLTVPMCVVSTPEMLWHGGVNEGGKTDPVYSIDMLGTEIIATSGIDDNTPPKGSTRLWKLSDQKVIKFLFEFNDHQSVVNVARFSPCGKFLATASDRLIIVYEVSSPSRWAELGESNPSITGPGFERIWFPHIELAEIYDLQWSYDSSYLIAGAINSKAQTIKIRTKETTTLVGHTSYVQGVAWDPLNKYVATQSADRSVKAHLLKVGDKGLKIANQGHIVIRSMSAIESSATGDMNGTDASEAAKPTSLYADSTMVSCFFRRLCFTPDGSLLITPTGILKPALLKSAQIDVTKAIASGGSFATHIFHRSDFSIPAVSLAGLEEPSIAVRCCPRIYSVLNHNKESTAASTGEGFPGDYRIIFAIATTSSVLIYDTQHLSAPLLKVSNLHFATINDLSWSADGQMLVVCSTDGYVSLVRFAEDAFGHQISIEETPVQIKKTFPCIYGYTPTTVPVNTTPTQQEDMIVSVTHQTESSSPASVSVITTDHITDNVMQSEKRKIIPMQVLLSPNQDENNISLVQNTENDCVLVQTVVDEKDKEGTAKKKKRITPMLVPNEQQQQQVATTAVAVAMEM